MKENAVYHGDYGIDYFVYFKGLLPLKVMPNFLLGVWKWDNWLLDTLIRGGIVPVIDGTSLLDAIHLRLNNVSHEARDGYDVNQALYVQYFNICYIYTVVLKITVLSSARVSRVLRALSLEGGAGYRFHHDLSVGGKSSHTRPDVISREGDDENL